MTTRTWARRLLGTVLVGGLLIVAGCASAAEIRPLAADEMGDRLAAAQREAGTFRFEGELEEAGEPVRYEGAIEYDESGDLEALSLTRFEGDRQVEAYRLVDDQLYLRHGEDGSFETEDDYEDLVRAWDWAPILEDMGENIESVEMEGRETISGVETQRYEVRFAAAENSSGERTETWWIGDDDLLYRTKIEGSSEDYTLSDYGEPVDIEVPTTE